MAKNYAKYFWCIPLAFGAAAFYILAGLKIFDPGYIGWLDVDNDPFQHQLGWMFFRESPWTMPIGLNPNFGLEISSSIVYSDSIPIFAFLFKLINAVLPVTFQYFGIWTLLCLILQAYFGWKLIGLATKSELLKLLALPLFVFSPILLNRIGMHAALAGHFLILAALYLSLNRTQKFRLVCWTLLLVICALAHFYLLVIVLGLYLVSILNECSIRPSSKLRSLKESIIILFSLFLVMWQAGYFAVGFTSAGGGWGYGTWGMNLLSFFNASGWSYLLPAIPGVESHQDRFQFPGAGVFLVLLFAFGRPLVLKETLKESLKNFPWLFYLLIAYTVFAISNHVGIGPIRFQYELPKFLLSAGNALRASDRFFWPVVYVLIIVGMYTVIKGYSKKLAAIIFTIASSIQVLDTHAGWGALRARLNVPSPASETAILKSPFWSNAVDHYSNIILSPAKNSPDNWRIFGSFAAESRMGTNAVYLARIDEKKLVQMQSALINGQINSSNLYVIEDQFIPYLLSNLDFKNDLLTKVDSFNVLAPNWKDCNQCEQRYQPLNLDQFINSTHLNQQIIFTANAGIDKRYLLNGWSNFIEDWGVWSEGSESQLILPIPKQGKAQGITLKLRALVNPTHPKQNIKIYTNGNWYADAQLTSFDDNIVNITLPKIALQQGYVAIKLIYPNAISPQQLGSGSDSRLLAIGIMSALFY